MKRISVLALATLASVALAAQENTSSQHLPAPKPALSEPALSPDGAEIAFVAGGDIWTVPAAGGEARILVANPATESRPLYSPDGKYLAFNSTRTGNGDVYVMTLATGELKRLTFDDAPEQAEAWSPDSRWIYFSSSSHDISGMNDIFRVSREGGTPLEVTADRYTTEFHAAPTPDGKALAFVARGVASGQWWRHGHSHLDESELWLLRDIGGRDYARLMPEGAKQLWPMWAPDGQTLYFMSDRSGQENLWSVGGAGMRQASATGDLSASARQLTHFTNGRLLWPSISANGRAIVFERGFGIWKFDVASGTASEVSIHLRGAPAGPSFEHLKLTNNLRDIALSPDGKKLVFAAHGQLFATGAKEGGEAVRITHSNGRESQVAWADDSHRIAYVSSRAGHDHIYLYDFHSDAETAITHGTGEESSPRFSPDGKLVAFVRGDSELVVADLAAHQEHVAAKGYFERPPLSNDRGFAWSPDSRYLAFANYGPRMFRNIYIVAAGGGEPRVISYLPNHNSGAITWSPDGKFILVDTGQRTEMAHVARIDLVPHTPKFREDQFRELFREESPERGPSTERPQTQPTPPDTMEDTKDEKKKDKPADDATQSDRKTSSNNDKSDDKAGRPNRKPAPRVEIVYEGIRDRVTLLPTGLDVNSLTISPDGKWLAMLAGRGDNDNLYVYSLDELAKEPPVAKQLTATSGQKRAPQFTPDSKELIYEDDGRIFRVGVEKPEPKPISVSAEMDVDFDTQKVEVFEEGWRDLRDNFFDEHMNGANWQQVHDELLPHVMAARTGDDLRRIMLLMIGELNSSHSGIAAPQRERVTSTGRLGLRFDRAEYEQNGRLRVTEVVGLGPAAIAGIKAGDTLLAIDGHDIGARTNLDELLDYTLDRKVSLTVAGSNGGARRTLSAKPVRLTVEKNLLYRDWVNRNRAYVDKMSGGKLGYVHMFDMSSDSLDRLFFDLDSENFGRKGVVIDVRNNNGGFVNAYALDVLTRRGYLTMTYRGATPAPARTILGQRSLELPTILVANQHSLSDAEDFTEGYRALGLGKVVGEPTGGWIIYTSNVNLIDGSSLRIPFIRVTDHENKPMELHPRAVDVSVPWQVGASYENRDPQLDAAVAELLKQLGEPAGKGQRAAAAGK